MATGPAADTASAETIEPDPYAKPATTADKKPMSFFDHLDELRKRLVVVAAALVIGSAIAWMFVDQILTILKVPLELINAGFAPGRPELTLYFSTPMSGFMAKVKIALFTGALISSPVTFYQILSFLHPALHKKERRFVYPMLIAATILGAAGVYAGYTYVFPIGIQWLVFQGIDAGINPILMVESYVSFSALFLVGMGLAAETPLILLSAIRFNIVTKEALKKNWRIVYVTILLSAAIITPDWSPVTMLAVAIPMAILYHITLLFAGLMKKKAAY